MMRMCALVSFDRSIALLRPHATAPAAHPRRPTGSCRHPRFRSHGRSRASRHPLGGAITAAHGASKALLLLRALEGHRADDRLDEYGCYAKLELLVSLRRQHP